MKTYNLIYDKEKNLENIIDNLTSINVIINEVFDSISMINVSSKDDNFYEVDGIIHFEEDVELNTVPALNWHQLRVASKTLPMKSVYIPKNTGNEVSVYLVDSGVDEDHPEFLGRNIVNFYSYDDTFGDTDGHGTAIASVIVGTTLGVSPDVILKVVKIPMGQNIPLSTLLTAFNAISADKIDGEFAVINCSWTIPKSRILDNLVSELRAQEFLVVGAAGNTISNADDLSPVGYNAVLGVGACDAFDRVISWAPNVGSNWGEEVDVFAPGIEVTVATKNGNFAEASGTSISSGIVSAIVAQYICDIDNILQLLKKETIDVNELQHYILSAAIEDVLFRNESIYENTPNRLIMANVLSKYYKNEKIPKIEVFPGSTYEFKLDLDERYVKSIRIDEVTMKDRTFVTPDWVVHDAHTNIIYISPPVDIEFKTYELFVEFLDENDNRLAIDRFRFKFMEDDIPDVPEIYRMEMDVDGVVSVTKAFAQCYFGNCFSPTACYAYGTKFTACVCYGYEATCFTQL
jgi:hypothetical protein